MHEDSPEPFLSRCPYCRRTVLVRDLMCPRCGFAFAWDFERLQEPPPPLSLGPLLVRFGAVIGVFAFILYFTLQTFTLGEGYTTEVIKRLIEAGVPSAPLPVTGEGDFPQRVQLALALLQTRAPGYYRRLTVQVTSIEFVPQGSLQFEGRIIRLTGIAAFIDVDTGAVAVRIPGAYLSGPGELYDRDVFYLAGVLVHEARHRELARVGLNIGGPREEYECERTAYDALVKMGAPRSLLQVLEQFLANPKHPRYRAWERYYEQYRREGQPAPPQD